MIPRDLNSLKNKLQSKTSIALLFRYGILCLLLIWFTLPEFELSYGSGLDESLPWVFNYLYDGHVEQSRNLIFPHGHLAFLLYPLSMGHNFFFASAFYLLIKLLLATSFFYLYRTLRTSCNWFIPFVILWLLFAVLEIQQLILASVISCYLLALHKKRFYFIYPAVLLSALSLYIKSYVGIMCVLTSASFSLWILLAEKNYKHGLVTIALLFLSYLMCWLLLYGNLHGTLNYLRGIQELASDNSAAVSFYPDNNWYLLGTAILLFLAIPFIHRQKEIHQLYVLLGLSIFAGWKHAMARQDGSHYIGFIFLLLVFFTFLFLFIRKHQFLTFCCCITVLCAFYMNYRAVYNYTEIQLHPFRIDNLQHQFLDQQKYLEEKERMNQERIQGVVLDEKVKSFIGKNTADIYPWDYGIVAANQLNWVPRPIIQSYAAYTPWLDEQNSQHLQSAQAPEFVIWQLSKYTQDVYGGNMESIDGRYLLNDEPRTMLAFFNRYELVHKDQQVMVFRRQEKSLLQTPVRLSTVKGTWGEWLDVPPQKDGIVRAKLHCSKKLIGKLKSFFYKDDELFVHYLLDNDVTLRYKIVPKNACDGIWINPLIQNAATPYRDAIVKKIQFSANKDMVDHEIQLEWEHIEINRAPAQKAYAQAFALFHKTLSVENLPHFSSSNNASDQVIPHWSPSTDQRIAGDYVSPPFAYKVGPDAYSSKFELPLDSLVKCGIKGREVTVELSAWVKSSPFTDALVVIGGEGKELKLWQPFAVHPFILQPDQWNYVLVNTRIQLPEHLSENQLYGYFWNHDPREMKIDNLKISIHE